MEQSTGLGTVLNVRTAKIFISQGHSCLSHINESAQARNSLKLILEKLSKHKFLLSESEYFLLVNQATQSIEENLKCLDNPATSILKDFKNPDDVYNSMLTFMEDMNTTCYRMIDEKNRIEYVIDKLYGEPSEVGNTLLENEELKIRILLLQKQVDRLNDESATLKKTISILSK